MTARGDVKDLRREQLMLATIASLSARGFANTTLSHVAAHARMSHGIVNFYFKSKDELLIATLRYLTDEYEAFAAAAIERAGPDPVARLRAAIEVDFDPLVVNRDKVTVWYAFWGETRWREDFMAHCARWSEQYHERVRALFAAVLAAHGRGDLDADAVARGLIAMLDGLWLDLLLTPDHSPAHAKRSIALYLASLVPSAFGPTALARTP